MDRRTWVRGAIAGSAALLLPASWSALSAGKPARMVVYKSPTCGCCKKWVEHVQAHGFETEVHDTDNVGAVKQQHGLPAGLASCHTALIDGYVIEGHVPADLIRKLLDEHPPLAGLAVPGMPASAPGMDIGNTPYEVIAFDRKGKQSVYAKR
jgi:hypothetical protein